MVFFLCPFMFSGTTFQTIAVLPTGGISELLGGYLGHLVLPNKNKKMYLSMPEFSSIHVTLGLKKAILRKKSTYLPH